MEETVIAEYARQLMEAHGERAIAEAAPARRRMRAAEGQGGPGGMSRSR